MSEKRGCLKSDNYLFLWHKVGSTISKACPRHKFSFTFKKEATPCLVCLEPDFSFNSHQKRFNCCWEEMSIEILIIFRVTTFAQHPMDPTHSYMLWSSHCFTNIFLCKVWVKKRDNIQKLTISKKSEFFVQSSWNLVKMTTTWGNHFHQVSWG